MYGDYWFDKSDFIWCCYNVYCIDMIVIIGELVIGWCGLQCWIVGCYVGVGCCFESNWVIC